MGFSAKSLKKLCVEVILKTYYYHGNLYCHFDEFSNVVAAFRKLMPALAKQTFCKNISARGLDFEKFLWFLNFVVQNINMNGCIIEANCRNLSEVNFFGYNYLNGKISVVLKTEPQHIPNLKEYPVDKKLFRYQPKDKCELDTKCKKVLKLAILNFALVNSRMEKCQFFFDLEKGITLNFYQTLKTLNFPAFTVKSKTYFSFFKSLVCGISLQYFLFHLSHDPPINDGDSINILRFVEKTKPIVNFAIPKNKKLSFDTLLNYLVSLSHLEETELNFLNIPYVQKKSVVKSLNRNLKSIKITLFQPISFLLYIGKKFENL